MDQTPRHRQHYWKPCLWGWRVLLALAAAGYLFQALSAGQFLQGDYDFLGVHQVGTTVLDGLMFLALIVAGLLKWLVRGPLRPLLGILGVIVVSQAQAMTGATRMVWMHVPLGVVLIGLVWLLAWYAWTLPTVQGGQR